MEKDLQFVGLIVFENRLKDETTPTIEVLNSADVRTVMVTGEIFPYGFVIIYFVVVVFLFHIILFVKARGLVVRMLHSQLLDCGFDL